MSETNFSDSLQLCADELGRGDGALLFRPRSQGSVAAAPAASAKHEFRAVKPVEAPHSVPGLAAGYRVQVVRDFRSFLRLEPEWNELMERTGMQNPFARHEWIRAWWECFGENKQMHVLVARSGGQVCAIAPLMLTRRSTYGVRLRRLEFIYNSHTPRCDFIVDREAPGACEALWQQAVSDTEWRVLVLQQLPAESQTPKKIESLASAAGYRTGRWDGSRSPYIRVRGDWEGFWAGLGRKHRSNMRNRFRRLAAIGALEARCVSSEDELGEALREGLRIESLAWKGQAGTAVLSNPRVSEFYRRIAAGFSRQGWLRLHFLCADNFRIAFDYSIVHRNRHYVLKTGYDPAFASYSPYNSLCWFKLRDAHRRGLDEYDFLGADDHWKMDWAASTRSHSWLFVFRGGIPETLLYGAKFSLLPALKRSRLYRAFRETAAGALVKVRRRGEVDDE
jgi:CelD/BcsL family acetyltransferase involved in cellulose biosynthesis